MTEQQIHRAVVQHLRHRGVPNLLFFHVPNGLYAGGKRNRRGVPVQAAIMKGLGVRAGVSDLLLFYNNRFYALELKTEKGKPTAAQMEFLSQLNAQGGHGAVVHGLDQALVTLERWGLLIGRLQV